MPTPIPEISPIVERWHPKATHEEKVEYTRDLRQFVVALVALNEKLRSRTEASTLPGVGLAMGSESIRRTE